MSRRFKRNDQFYLLKAHVTRLSLAKPQHSNFRVVALMLLDDDSIILGANDEPGPSISGALCAERAAFLQYRILEAKMGTRRKVKTVYIVTDSEDPISPGTLCREYMYGHHATSPATRIVLQSADSTSTPLVLSMAELYPYPTIYAGLSVSKQMEAGKRYQSHLIFETEGMLSRELVDSLVQLAQKEVLRPSLSSSVHPVRYGAAAALSSDDSPNKRVLVSASQLQALEYGSTQDAVCQVAAQFGSRLVVAIAMVDQFGIPHAPFASARSLLVEHGHGDCAVLVSSPRKDSTDHLVVSVVKARALTPFVPDPEFLAVLK